MCVQASPGAHLAQNLNSMPRPGICGVNFMCVQASAGAESDLLVRVGLRPTSCVFRQALGLRVSSYLESALRSASCAYAQALGLVVNS